MDLRRRTTGVVVSVLLGAGAALAGAVLTPAARADVVWLCKPGEQPDPCRESQRTTHTQADGTTRVTDDPLPADPPVDCFYVYPTVSQQLGVNADKTKADELVAIARSQAARYSQECRVFAPVYRQLTLLSIYTGTAQARAAGRKIAYADVAEAFRQYLAQDNGGRGFVLIGHSQGASMLRQLIRAEVDGVPAVRRRLLSAVLLGGNVLVRKGQPAGGDFQQVPACTSPVQLGCVIAFSTFNATPPANARFGRAPATDITGAGLPAGPGYEVLCTNPASLAANARTPLTSLVRTDVYPNVIGGGYTVTYDGAPPTADTPWVQPAERYSGRCEQANGANVLMLAPIGDARRLTPFPTPDWGLHIIDGSVALGDLVDVVHAEAGAYRAVLAREAAPHLGLGLSFRRSSAAGGSCARGAILVRVLGPDRPHLRRADVLVGGRRLARAVRAPFRLRIPRARLPAGALVRLQVRAVLDDGRTARLSRTVRTCFA